MSEVSADALTPTTSILTHRGTHHATPASAPTGKVFSVGPAIPRPFFVCPASAKFSFRLGRPRGEEGGGGQRGGILGNEPCGGDNRCDKSRKKEHNNNGAVSDGTGRA